MTDGARLGLVNDWSTRVQVCMKFTEARNTGAIVAGAIVVVVEVVVVVDVVVVVVVAVVVGSSVRGKKECLVSNPVLECH